MQLLLYLYTLKLGTNTNSQHISFVRMTANTAHDAVTTLTKKHSLSVCFPSSALTYLLSKKEGKNIFKYKASEGNKARTERPSPLYWVSILPKIVTTIG